MNEKLSAKEMREITEFAVTTSQRKEFDIVRREIREAAEMGKSRIIIRGNRIHYPEALCLRNEGFSVVWDSYIYNRIISW